MDDTHDIKRPPCLGEKITKISQAVEENDIQKLREILHGMAPQKRIELLNGTSIKGQPLLHSAVRRRFKEMTKFLLSQGVSESLLNQVGRSVLHEAVRTGDIDMTNILLQKRELYDETDGLSAVELAFDSVAALARTGQLVNLKDQAGLTPLILLTDAATVSPEEFSAIVKILLESGADPCQVHPGNGQTALFRAVELQSFSACSDLVGAGVDVDVKDSNGDTALHKAARQDSGSILQFLVQCSRQSVNKENLNGNTPLHCAAFAGARSCLNILLNYGGDLSKENMEDLTVLDIILTHLPRPATFLIETLNSKITPNNCSINDRQFEMTIDFRILSPDREKQMDVVVAFMNALRTMDSKKILQHPLIETYLRFKWTRLQIFFFGLFFIHLIFVLSLSAHILWLLYPEDVQGIVWSRRVLLGTASLLIVHILAQTSFAPRYFLKEPETWLSLSCVCMGFLMSLCGEFIPTPVDTEWVRHVASFTVLLSWGQIMFVLGRFPSIGLFALMFFTVLKNVVKALIIFACLVIGFSLSFCVQFNSFEYDGALRSILRTTVMLMGEYDYQNLFEKPNSQRWLGKPNNLFITSQVIFLLFVLLGSIVLVNLMIGMAVNDIQAIQAEGSLRHMIKQAEFLLHVDRILSYSKYCNARKATPSVIIINPSTINKVRENTSYKRMGLNIPPATIERMVMLALKNQRRDSDGSPFVPQLDVRDFDQKSVYNSEYEIAI